MAHPGPPGGILARHGVTTLARLLDETEVSDVETDLTQPPSTVTFPPCVYCHRPSVVVLGTTGPAWCHRHLHAAMCELELVVAWLEAGR